MTCSPGNGCRYVLPVLPLQQPVTVSTSFAMAANKSFTRWVEGFALPPAVPNSGALGVTAGII